MKEKKDGGFLRWPWNLVIYALLLIVLRLFAIPVILILMWVRQKNNPNGAQEGYCLSRTRKRIGWVIWGILWLAVSAVAFWMLSIGLQQDRAIETSFHPEFCQCLDTREEASASFSPERTAELFDNAVTAALELYDGEELYTVFHGSFGMTLREIREHRYFSDEELSDICGVPQQMLDCGMRVRDILHLDGVSDRASLSHKNSIALVPLEDLKKLTPSGQEETNAYDIIPNCEHAIKVHSIPL